MICAKVLQPWTSHEIERLYGKAMMRPYDLLPSTVWTFNNAVRYYDLARTME